MASMCKRNEVTPITPAAIGTMKRKRQVSSHEKSYSIIKETIHKLKNDLPGVVARSVAMPLLMQAVTRSIPASSTLFL